MNSAWKRNYWSLYKEDMKTVRAVATVICSEDKIFATARGYGEFKANGSFLEERPNMGKHHKKP